VQTNELSLFQNTMSSFFNGEWLTPHRINRFFPKPILRRAIPKQTDALPQNRKEDFSNFHKGEN